MGRPKKAAVAIEEVIIEQVAPVIAKTINRVQPLTQEFGNGDLNILRDKINEIIRQ